MMPNLQEKIADLNDSRVNFIAINMYRTYKNKPEFELSNNSNYPYYWFKQFNTYIIEMMPSVNAELKNKYADILYAFMTEYRDTLSKPFMIRYKEALVQKAHEILQDNRLTEECRNTVTKFCELT
jgi:hypothetical protein